MRCRSLPSNAKRTEKKRKQQLNPTKNVPDGHIRFPLPKGIKTIGRSSVRAGLTAAPIFTVGVGWTRQASPNPPLQRDVNLVQSAGPEAGQRPYFWPKG